ncbi:MAG TPA: DUF1549 and DUF1553 domain-containing protein [Pirellulales bacterium]|jgi:hypothetical protein|nr:DUF1549 and DUF1553 domain-containing protein [Pirellulales bacterium]
MKRTLKLSCFGIAMLLLAQRVPAVEPPAPAATAEGVESLPPGTKLLSIEARPRSIDFQQPFQYAQLLLTGKLSSGDAVDVTRMAKLATPADFLSISDSRLIRPLHDGEATLTFELAGQSVTVPVKAHGLKSEYQVSFCRDCMPLMSKLGCNAGTCHGSAKGKNGFKLSLRGYDPVFDYTALTDDLAARRFNRASPEHSLMLMKLCGMVPHVGGVLSKPGEPSYELIKKWIEQGVRFDAGAPKVAKIEVLPANPIIPLPKMKQQISVQATYTDGSVRDVTAEAFVEGGNIEVLEANKSGLVTALRRGESAVLVRFEGNYAATTITCMGDRADFVWKDQPVNNYIDELVNAKLQRVKTSASGLCSDTEFLRRIHLDLTGLPPTPAEVRAFLADTRDTNTKRNEIIDRLLGSGDYVEHWANKWADLLQVNSKFLGDQGAWAFRNWIKQAVASNMPYDQFVYQILTAKGSNLENPPAAYFKVLRTPDDVMENTTQLFLAVRFNCNKCHDHPFERWTQNQHGELAAYFAKIGRKEDPRHAGQKIGGSAVEGATALVEDIYDTNSGEVKHPNTGAVMQPKFPYPLADPVAADGSLREQLARWITSPENDYFAKSYVNRLWSYLLGVGLIEPVDDIRAGNPPTNPELLNRLTRDFIASKFNAQEMLRLICKSRTYQRSIATDKWNVDDTVNYSHATARRLSAEVLYDTIYNVTGATRNLPNMPAGARAEEERDPAIRLDDGFLELSGRPARESACECERSSGVMLGMVLNLINGPTMANAINQPNNAIQKLVESEKDDSKLVEAIFLRVLNRFPTEKEVQAGVATLQAKDDGLPQAQAALAEYEKTLAPKQAEWEQHAGATSWTPLILSEAKSTAGATFAKEADQSILVTGKPAHDTYTLTLPTELTGITGLRLEALADDRLPGKGPGRAPNGNFVVNEIRLSVASKSDPQKTQKGEWAQATADFSQESWAVAGAIDGNPATGWAVSPHFGVNHTAIFELKQPVGFAGGSIVTIEIEHKFSDGQHELGKFRLSVSNSHRPLGMSGPPENIAKLLAIPEPQRSAPQRAELTNYFRQLDGQYMKLEQDVKKFQSAQVNSRLLGAQDLTWVLLNTPAFLFNR